MHVIFPSMHFRALQRPTAPSRSAQWCGHTGHTVFSILIFLSRQQFRQAASHSSFSRQQTILLHKKGIVSLTERSENATAFSKLAEKGLRLSMKKMFVPVCEEGMLPI